MCDHCVKRERAYRALPFDQRAEVDAFTEEANARMAQATEQAMAEAIQSGTFFDGPPAELQEEMERLLLASGDALDLMLGLTSVPEYPPNFA